MFEEIMDDLKMILFIAAILEIIPALIEG